MNILFRGWFNIYHSYANVSYFLLKQLKNKKDLNIFVQQMPFYNPNWIEKYENDLDLPIYTNQKIDLVINMYFPYIYDKELEVPQIIFFTTEFPFFNDKFWNLSLEEIRKHTQQKKLFLLTCSQKSAQPLLDLSLPVFIIKHGFDSQFFFPSNFNFRNIMDIKDSQKVFLNISSCTGNKNLKTLILAFSELIKTEGNEECILILKGINDLYHSQILLINTIDNHKLDLKISNFRFIFDSLSFSDLNTLYNSADVYVSCGIDEGFDVPIVEAKACGLKVITHEKSPNNFLADANFQTTEELVQRMINIDNYLNKKIDDSYQYSQISNEFSNLLDYVYQSKR